MPLKVQREDQSSINLTPLIDIVFLLIIFFMVGSRFTELNEQEKSIELDVPSVANGVALTDAPSSRVINVLKDGSIMLDDQLVSLEELAVELKATREQYKQLGVVIRGDANSRYQQVADVIATCKEAEIGKLNISVKRIARQTNQTTNR